jgi:hypothetical protein
MGRGEASLEKTPTAWPSFLRGADSAEILARMSTGDPLRLLEIASRRLRERWILLDPDRVFYRALGVCADAAAHEDPPGELAEWARSKVDLAIDQLVRTDREAESAEQELAEAEASFPLLTDSFMLEPELVLPASVAFNALPDLPRRAFFELLIEGCELAQCLERGPWDEDGLYEAIQEALASLGLDVSPDSFDPPDSSP